MGHGQCASYDTVSKKSMRTLFLSLLLIAPAFAGDKQFNGRWDIKVINEPRNRAWWLEVDGAVERVTTLTSELKRLARRSDDRRGDVELTTLVRRVADG